jgi:guanylate kinase
MVRIFFLKNVSSECILIYIGLVIKIGTSIKSVEDVVEAGKVCMLDIDMQGVQSVKKTQLNPKYIFVQPPSLEILEQRLRGRGTEKEEAVLARLDASKRELEYSAIPGAYDHVIVNDDLETAYNSLKNAIFV